MANYKIKSNAFGNNTISKVHLNADAADWVTSDGIKDLGTFDTFDSLIDKLNEMHGKDHTDVKAKNYLGHFRAQHSSSFFDIMNNCTYYLGDLWVQSITGNLKLNKGVLSPSSDNIGTFVRKHNAEGWSKWEISNNSEIVDESSEIILRLQGTSDKSDSRLDGFKWLGNFNDGTGFTKAYELFNDALNSLTYDTTKIGNNYGYFRANVGGHRQLEIKNLLISSSRNYIVQVVSGCFTIRENKIVEAVDIYTVAARIHRAHKQNDKEVWSWEEWKIVSDSRGSTQTVNYSPDSIISNLNDKEKKKEFFTPYLSDGIPYNTGNYISLSSAGTSSLELKVYALDWNRKIFMQSVFGPITLNSDNELVWVNGLEFGEFYRTSSVVDGTLTWGEWKIVNHKIISVEQQRAEQAEFELLQRLRGLSENSNPKTDPYKYIDLGQEANIKENMINFENKLNELYSLSNVGYYRINVNNQSSIEVNIIQLSSTLKAIMQVVKGPLLRESDAFSMDFGSYRTYYRSYQDSANKTGWTEWREINDNEKDRAQQAEGNLSSLLEAEESRAQQAEDNLLLRLQGKSSESSAKDDPFKLLKPTKGEQFDIWENVKDTNDNIVKMGLLGVLDGLHGKTSAEAIKHMGVFRALLNYSVVTIINNPLSVGGDVWCQTVIGGFRIDNGNLVVGYNNSGVFYRKHENDAWGSWKVANEDIIKGWIEEMSSSDSDVAAVKSELEKRIQGTSDNSSAWDDSFKRIKDFGSLQALDTYLQGWHGESFNGYEGKITVNKIGDKGETVTEIQKYNYPATKNFIGRFRTSVGGYPIEIFSTYLSIGDKNSDDGYKNIRYEYDDNGKKIEIIEQGDSSQWIQEIKGAIEIDKGAVNHLGVDNNYGWYDNAYTEKIEGESESEGEEKKPHTWYRRSYKQGLRIVSGLDILGVRTLRRMFRSGAGWSEWVDVTNPYINSPLYGKNVLMLGGSFAHNMQAYMSDEYNGYGFIIKGRKYSLQNYIAKELGLKRFDNFAVAGNGVCIDNTDFKYNIYTQLKNAISCATENGYKYDAIIFVGGINDYQASSPLGALSEFMCDNTFYGSYKKIINKARTYNPDVKLFMTTPFKAFHLIECWNSTSTTVNSAGHKYYEYLQAIKDISQWASIPLLDIWSIQQVDSNNYAKFYRVDPKYPNDEKKSDKTHPNGKGYLQIANAMLEFLAWGKGASTFDNEALTLKLNDKITVEQQRAEQAEFELLQRLRGLSENSNPKTDPYKYIDLGQLATTKENMINFDNKLNELYNLSDVGYYRINVNNQSSIEVNIIQLSSTLNAIMQVVKGPLLRETDAFSIDFDSYTYRTYYRSYQDSANKTGWTEWRDVESELLLRLQGASKNNVNFDPFIKLSWEPSDVNKNINSLCPTGGNNANTTGYFRSYSTDGISCLDIKVDVLSWAYEDEEEGKSISERFMQTVSGPVTLINDNTELCWVNGVPQFGPGHYYRVSERQQKESVRKWSEWKPVNNHIIEQLQNQIKELQEQIALINSKIN